jgi:hypothetical protein
MTEDKQHDYMVLGRMQMDNDAFLQTEPIKHLYMGNVEDQIKEMKRLWKAFVVKPEWISWEDILDYEKKMNEVENQAEK